MKSVLYEAVLFLGATTVLAQTSTPAGAINQTPQSSGSPRIDSAIAPLRLHVERGAWIGGATGLLASSVLVAGLASQGCRESPPLPPGQVATSLCTSGVTTGKAVRVIGASTVIGALVGSVLGYSYHVNAEERRKAKCRVAPEDCK